MNERVKRTLDRRRSNAAGKHRDKRTRRLSRRKIVERAMKEG